MSSSAFKRGLSQSTDGEGIVVSAIGPTGTVIHTSVNSSAVGTWDEVFLDAMNIDTDIVTLTLEWGGADSTKTIIIAIPPQSGFVPVAIAKILHNSKVIRAYASEASKIIIYGYVNLISDS